MAKAAVADAREAASLLKLDAAQRSAFAKCLGFYLHNAVRDDYFLDPGPKEAPLSDFAELTVFLEHDLPKIPAQAERVRSDFSHARGNCHALGTAAPEPMASDLVNAVGNGYLPQPLQLPQRHIPNNYPLWQDDR